MSMPSMRIVEETLRIRKFVQNRPRQLHLPMTKTTDWADYTHRMIALCQRLGVDHYIKRDLQPFLPPGYFNAAAASAFLRTR